VAECSGSARKAGAHRRPSGSVGSCPTHSSGFLLRALIFLVFGDAYFGILALTLVQYNVLLKQVAVASTSPFMEALSAVDLLVRLSRKITVIVDAV